MTTWRPARKPRSELDPEPLNAALERVTRKLSMADPSTLSMVFSKWESLVGADIAAHAKPRSLHGGVLVLEVDHPAWATQLRYMSFDIISSVNASTKPGLVEEVRVVVGKSERQESARRRGFDTPV